MSDTYMTCYLNMSKWIVKKANQRVMQVKSRNRYSGQHFGRYHQWMKRICNNIQVWESRASSSEEVLYFVFEKKKVNCAQTSTKVKKWVPAYLVMWYIDGKQEVIDSNGRQLEYDEVPNYVVTATKPFLRDDQYGYLRDHIRKNVHWHTFYRITFGDNEIDNECLNWIKNKPTSLTDLIIEYSCATGHRIPEFEAKIPQLYFMASYRSDISDYMSHFGIEPPASPPAMDFVDEPEIRIKKKKNATIESGVIAFKNAMIQAECNGICTLLPDGTISKEILDPNQEGQAMFIMDLEVANAMQDSKIITDGEVWYQIDESSTGDSNIIPSTVVLTKDDQHLIKKIIQAACDI